MRTANDAAERSKTVSSLGISADSPPITYHSRKVRVDNGKMCIHYIVHSSVDLMLGNVRQSLQEEPDYRGNNLVIFNGARK
jgi:hypothetical protein